MCLGIELGVEGLGVWVNVRGSHLFSKTSKHSLKVIRRYKAFVFLRCEGVVILPCGSSCVVRA